MGHGNLEGFGTVEGVFHDTDISFNEAIGLRVVGA